MLEKHNHLRDVKLLGIRAKLCSGAKFTVNYLLKVYQTSLTLLFWKTLPFLTTIRVQMWLMISEYKQEAFKAYLMPSFPQTNPLKTMEIRSLDAYILPSGITPGMLFLYVSVHLALWVIFLNNLSSFKAKVVLAVPSISRGSCCW